MTSTSAESLLEMLTAAFTTIPFNRMLGLSLEEIDAKHVVMRFSMKNDLIGNFMHNILHGGVISSVLDMAGGMAVMSAAIHKKHQKSIDELTEILSKCSTIDLQISFIRPGRGEFFTATAYLVKSGNKISFTRMELHNENNQLIATGTGTYYL